MKAATQRRAELTALVTLIEPITVAMLTHVDVNGALICRPMTPLEIDDMGAIWFFTERRSADGKDLRALNLSFSDASHATYVSLSGRGEVTQDREHIQRLWSQFARPWFPGGPQDENLALLKFIPELAEYWDAPNNKMARMFALAVLVVAGKPVGMGQHDTLTDLDTRPAARVIAPAPTWRYANCG